MTAHAAERYLREIGLSITSDTLLRCIGEEKIPTGFVAAGKNRSPFIFRRWLEDWAETVKPKGESGAERETGQ